ncbi:MAG: ABC transporter ATP-binding protein [Alphaproteobacteria bacterium]|nr:ABC transporter ATP-binding protein [Alphaproteobacteria bacterium]
MTDTVPFMRTTALSVRFGRLEVLRGVDFAVDSGEVVGLIGPNGAGKTTLLRAMAGLLPPAAGAIAVAGRPLTEIDRQELAIQIGYLPQSNEVHWAMTVEALVAIGRLPHLGRWRRLGATDRAAVDRAIAACDLEDLRDRPMTRLSGGERSRALLARALAVEPKLLLADEPVAGLDPAHQLDVMQKLRILAADGTGVVVVMHDLTHAARFCDRLALMFEGGIAAVGSAADVLTPDLLARCFGIKAFHGEVGDESFVLPLERTDYAGPRS